MQDTAKHVCLLCDNEVSGAPKLCVFCDQERRAEAEKARFLSRVTSVAFDADSYSEEKWAKTKAAEAHSR